ncbi:hypothetical protein INS49_010618 [Diaporthe citri]|uniref:uncharacterized protein n=1 Tax=Diaporthe citri TaxID=83186 RepID=UPI001C7E4ACE|nr:uncharacterized protein INS49_010618 [Diaporthe citri]KAG6362388.1 hypothetical protein INS49_010618 [Diaporthe citri]
MKFFTKTFTVLAVIMAYAHNVLVASDDEMATLCFDQLTWLPYINACFFKPEKSDAGQCKPLDHLFDGIDCTGPPDVKFEPTKILVGEPYTCYLFK